MQRISFLSECGQSGKCLKDADFPMFTVFQMCLRKNVESHRADVERTDRNNLHKMKKRKIIYIDM